MGGNTAKLLLLCQQLLPTGGRVDTRRGLTLLSQLCRDSGIRVLSSRDRVSVWEDANVLEMDGDDVNTSVNILNFLELYT